MSKQKKKQSSQKVSKAKAFWSRVWFGFCYWFKTLYSNGACLLAREKPWWASLPVVVLSIVIALIPTAVSMGNMNASSFITSSDYGLVTPTASFVHDMEEKGVTLRIEDGALVDVDSSWAKAYGENKNGAYFHTVTRQIVELPSGEDSSSSSLPTSSEPPVVSEETIIDFAVYYDYQNLYEGKVQELFDFIMDEEVSQDPNGEEMYQVSSLFLAKDGYILVLLPNHTNENGETSGTAIRYQWDASEYQNKTLVELLKPTFEEEAPAVDSYEYRAASRLKWGTFLDEGYASTKWSVGWTTVGILSAIVVGTIFVMGLIVFLATRGKNNPYRPLNFWDAQQVVYFESFSCSVIAMILGFMFGGSNYVMSMTIFMMVIAVRVIYTIFKTMRGPVME